MQEFWSWRVLSCGTWHYIAWYFVTDISGECAASIFTPLIRWRWSQNIPAKQWHLSTRLHSLTSQKAVVSHSYCYYNLIKCHIFGDCLNTLWNINTSMKISLCVLLEVSYIYIVCRNHLLTMISITKANA
jgi:hypothetical protein